MPAHLFQFILVVVVFHGVMRGANAGRWLKAGAVASGSCVRGSVVLTLGRDGVARLCRRCGFAKIGVDLEVPDIHGPVARNAIGGALVAVAVRKRRAKEANGIGPHVAPPKGFAVGRVDAHARVITPTVTRVGIGRVALKIGEFVVHCRDDRVTDRVERVTGQTASVRRHDILVGTTHGETNAHVSVLVDINRREECIHAWINVDVGPLRQSDRASHGGRGGIGRGQNRGRDRQTVEPLRRNDRGGVGKDEKAG